MSLNSGDIIVDRYQIDRLLGRGGFSQTYLARDMIFPSNYLCVVKEIKSLSHEPVVLEEVEKRFQIEADILARLDQHDCIPKLFAYFKENGNFYLVQEYIEGNELSQELKLGKPLSEAEVINLLTDILGVVNFVHRKHIIHRDIKPANLLRRKQDGKIVLIDFGSVKEIINLARTNTDSVKLTKSFGTIGYTPIEQVFGKPNFSSDIYAVGIIGIQSLTGLDPANQLQTDEYGEILWRHFASNINPRLANILDKMVRQDFKHRYQSVAEVLQDIKSLIKPSDRSAAEVIQDLQDNGNWGENSLLSPTSYPLATKKVTSYNQTNKLYPSIRKTSLNWQVIDTLNGHSGSVESVAISPDGEILASGSHDRTIKLWHLPDRREICTLNGHNDRVSAVVFSPDGKVIVSGSYDQNIKLWQVEKEEEFYTIKGNCKWITCLAISRDGETLVSGSSDGTIKLWHFKHGKELGTIKAHNEHINAIAISTDGKIFASVSSDGKVKLWDFQTGEKLKTFGDGLLRINFFCSVAFSPDGKRLVKGRVDGTIHLWDLAQKRELGMLKGHKHKVLTLAFNPDGETFASGSSDRTIKIWQVGNRESIATLTDHLKEVYTLAFTPDGQMLVSGSMDKTIKIWGW